MGNTLSCCNRPNDQNGAQEANLTHSNNENTNPGKVKGKLTKPLYDNKKDDIFFPNNVTNIGRHFTSTAIYDSMYKNMKLEEYIKNKMKGIEPHQIFLIIYYIYNQIIIKENNPNQSKLSDNLIFEIQINYKRLINELNQKSIDNNLTQTVPLLNALLNVTIEIFHYIQFENFCFKKNENTAYEKNLWSDVKSVHSHIKGKILLGVDKLIQIKVLNY